MIQFDGRIFFQMGWFNHQVVRESRNVFVNYWESGGEVFGEVLRKILEKNPKKSCKRMVLYQFVEGKRIAGW